MQSDLKAQDLQGSINKIQSNNCNYDFISVKSSENKNC